MDFFQLIFYFLIIIPSAVVHEVAHGLAAYWLGDDTAKRAGRLTLNPAAHIDMFGTILLPLLFVLSRTGLLFAYAKPVPYNPYNLKSEVDELKVALAGPISNFIIAGSFAVVARLLNTVPSISNAAVLLSILVYANIALAIFNLVPIPPLDGSKLLYLLIPKENYQIRAFLNQYGMFLLLFFVFFGVGIIAPVIGIITNFFLGNELFIELINLLNNIY